jgi:hypothetical protein
MVDAHFEVALDHYFTAQKSKKSLLTLDVLAYFSGLS